MTFAYVSWEAFATIFTGVLAVGAAACVGWNQVAIANRQTEILGRQVALQERTLRSDLLNQRLEVFDEAGRFSLEIVAPTWSHNDNSFRAFQEAQHKSQFLFSNAVTEKFKNVAASSLQLSVLAARLRGEEGPLTGEEKVSQTQEVFGAQQACLRELDALGALMIDEMRLSPIRSDVTAP